MKRCSRQETFLGKNNQKLLRKKTVSLVGVGGLGSVSVELLCRANIGKLILIDNDKVELSNLQRQTLFTEKDIGKNKALQAKKHLKEINRNTKIIAYNKKLTKNNLYLINSDLILDCTDNFVTRFILNDFALENKIPFIFCAVAGSKGYLMNIIKKPCLRCIFKKVKGETCTSIGILNSLIFFASSLQVTQAIKILLKQKYEKDLLYFDIWSNKIEKIKVSNLECDYCR